MPFDKIKRTLARHRATVADIVKIVTYVTDIRSAGNYFKCLAEALAMPRGRRIHS